MQNKELKKTSSSGGLIEIKDLTYTYNPKSPFETRALDKVSLTIERGDFFGIIGQTGSGKSTLISHINALTRVQLKGKVNDCATVNVCGIDLTAKKPDLKRLREKVGMVFQYPEYQLFADTVREDVAFGPKNLGIGDAETEERVREAIRLVGLNYTEISERSPFELSGGQKRRVAIAGVLLYPDFRTLMEAVTVGDTAAHFLGIPIASVKYTHTVIPAFCMTWILSYIERLIDKITPAVTKNFLKPMLIILIAAPIGILFVVGVDVGMNTVTPKLLIERVGMDTTNATLGISVYSLCRTIGALIGAAMLLKMADMKYYKIHIYIALVAIIALFFAQGEIAILALVGIIGYTCSSIFSVIFSQALKARPEKANEISGLMVTGICGGAIIPPVMGALTDNMGSQIGSVLVIAICILYLVFFSLIAKTSK